MKSHTRYLTFNTRKRRELVRITDEVAEACRESGIQEGMVLVSAMHITAGVFVNDDEPGLHADIEEWLQRLAPGPGGRRQHPGPDYRHHRTGEDNGDAHLKNLLIGHQVIVPDHRGQARPRALAADLLLRVRRAAAQAPGWPRRWHGRPPCGPLPT